MNKIAFILLAANSGYTNCLALQYAVIKSKELKYEHPIEIMLLLSVAIFLRSLNENLKRHKLIFSHKIKKCHNRFINNFFDF
jgi:hypothetical protein